MPYAADHRWTGQDNTGQSLLALRNLSLSKGYSLVYAIAPNAFLALTSTLPPRYREVSVRKASRESWLASEAHRGVARDPDAPAVGIRMIGLETARGARRRRKRPA